MSPELTERQALMVLNDLPNIGPVTLHRLLEEFGGDPLRILSADRRRLEGVRGVGPETSAALLNWPQHFDVAKEEERLARAGAVFITSRDEGYPRLLKQIHDPPIGLYRKGGYRFEQPCIAIVGSRRTTLYGQSVAKRLAADLARAGFCVVSGLARGIDTAAHEGALSVGGRTAAVLGTGIDIVYPAENLGLYRRLEEAGAVLTEFPFGRRADRQGFVGNLRNPPSSRKTCLPAKGLHKAATVNWGTAKGKATGARHEATGSSGYPRGGEVHPLCMGKGLQAAAGAVSC